MFTIGSFVVTVDSDRVTTVGTGDEPPVETVVAPPGIFSIHGVILMDNITTGSTAPVVIVEALLTQGCTIVVPVVIIFGEGLTTVTAGQGVLIGHVVITIVVPIVFTVVLW